MDVAQDVIAHTGLTVDRKRRNKAIVALALIKYAECDLGDYHELALSFVVEAPAASGFPSLGLSVSLPKFWSTDRP